jgi:hypothetical protein
MYVQQGKIVVFSLFLGNLLKDSSAKKCKLKRKAQRTAQLFHPQRNFRIPIFPNFENKGKGELAMYIYLHIELKIFM